MSGPLPGVRSLLSSLVGAEQLAGTVMAGLALGAPETLKSSIVHSTCVLTPPVVVVVVGAAVCVWMVSGLLPGFWSEACSWGAHAARVATAIAAITILLALRMVPEPKWSRH